MNTVINIRTDKNVRDEAKKVFSKMGLSTSAGINIFLHQVVTEKGLPFTPTSDMKKLRARWDTQVAESLKAKKYPNALSALRGLTKAETATVRRGEAQIKAGRSKPWSTVKHGLDR
jgi:DNA-damage-inducible protein J